MNEIIKVNYETDEPTVSARDLYKELEVKYDFSRWVKSNFSEFVENADYSRGHIDVSANRYGGKQTLNDYNLSIDMAKHLCLMSKTEKGKQCRQYLIDLEKAWNTPEQVMARALKLADKTIKNLELTIEEQRPLVDFANKVSNSSNLIDMGKMAKLLKDEHINIGRNRLFEWLRRKEILMKNNMPYQRYIEGGYFQVKESVYETPYGSKTQQTTYVTGKGQIYITEKLRKEISK